MPRLNATGWMKLTALAGIATLLAPAQVVTARLRRGQPSRRITQAFYRACCRVVGVRVRVVGSAPRNGDPVLVVSNHISWLDIPIIGAQHHVAFVAKAEVAQWPGVGPMARIQRTVFIDRSRRAATADVSAEIGERIAQGEAIVLFAEGTTSDGNRVLPFRSALFGAVREAGGAALDRDLIVQPLAIVYLGRNGLPGGRQGRADLAWSGDTELAPHATGILNGGPIDVALIWGEPIRARPDQSRKDLTAAAEVSVRRAFMAALRGA
jgi:1-acyl-sn-glycerol-3-phosphate acyltransferase